MECKATRVKSFNECKNPGDFVIETLYPPDNLRDLTPEEIETHNVKHKCSYVKYEEYPPSDDYIVGRYWSQEQLDAVASGPIVTGLTFRCPCGCGSIGGIHFALYNPRWTWNGDKDNPTCTPSILRGDGCRWHGFLTNGVFISC
jgi:hypothetical protein